MKYVALLIIILLQTLVACGGSSTVGANATNANVTARAIEPRTGDATAAPPPSGSAPNPGAALVGSSSSSSGSSSSSSGPAASSTAEPEGPPPKGAAKTDTTPPKKIAARHVLISWMGTERAPQSVVRTREQALAVAQEVHRRAKKGDDFVRLAVEYSDEPNAAARGGSLGRFGKGQMVGAFEEAAFKLQVGQVSEIVETPFGYHVIQRTE